MSTSSTSACAAFCSRGRALDDLHHSLHGRTRGRQPGSTSQTAVADVSIGLEGGELQSTPLLPPAGLRGEEGGQGVACCLLIRGLPVNLPTHSEVTSSRSRWSWICRTCCRFQCLLAVKLNRMRWLRPFSLLKRCSLAWNPTDPPRLLSHTPASTTLSPPPLSLPPCLFLP